MNAQPEIEILNGLYLMCTLLWYVLRTKSFCFFVLGSNQSKWMQQNISLQKFEFREGMVCLQMSSVFVSFFFRWTILLLICFLLFWSHCMRLMRMSQRTNKKSLVQKRLKDVQENHIYQKMCINKIKGIYYFSSSITIKMLKNSLKTPQYFMEFFTTYFSK